MLNDAVLRIPSPSLLLLSLLLAYLAGAIPVAYLVGRANGVDLRTVGSGNLGATNVFRTLGWKAGLFTYVADMLKGALPVLLLPSLARVDQGWPWGVAFGVLAIAGHVKPIFLMGKGGGKGVATASGVFLALAPVPFVCAFVVFVVVVALTRYVSLASLASAAALPVALLVRDRAITPLVIVGSAVAAFVFWTHRENIVRLRNGNERRVTGRSGERA